MYPFSSATCMAWIPSLLFGLFTASVRNQILQPNLETKIGKRSSNEIMQRWTHKISICIHYSIYANSRLTINRKMHKIKLTKKWLKPLWKEQSRVQPSKQMPTKSRKDHPLQKSKIRLWNSRKLWLIQKCIPSLKRKKESTMHTTNKTSSSVASAFVSSWFLSFSLIVAWTFTNERNIMKCTSWITCF